MIRLTVGHTELHLLFLKASETPCFCWSCVHL